MLTATFSFGQEADSQAADSPKAEFGFRLMPTLSSINMKSETGGTIKGDATIGFGAGLFFGFAISKHVGFQVEAMYTSLNQKFQEMDEERKINLRYFNVPLLFVLNTTKLKPVSFNLVAGPQIGISAGSSIESSNNSHPDINEPTLSVKKGDLGFAYGAGVNFALDEAKKIRLGLGYRGVLGLIDISDDSNTIGTDSYYVLDRTTIRTHSIYAGVSFLF
jgi:opacity protein-like surface antigen